MPPPPPSRCSTCSFWLTRAAYFALCSLCPCTVGEQRAVAGGGTPEEEVRDEYVRNMTPSFTPILAPASLPYGSLLSAYSGRCPAAVRWRGRGGWPAGCVAWAQRRFLSRAACTACAAQRGLRSQQPVEMHSTLRGLQLSWHTATHLPHRPSRGWCQSSGPRPRSATGACAAPAPSSPESGLQCKQGGWSTD